MNGAWECVFVHTLVYVCLSVIEGPTGAVPIPMRMGVCAVCSHMCVCPWPGYGAYLFSTHHVHPCACVCVHVCTQVHAHRGELKEREILDRLSD